MFGSSCRTIPFFVASHTQKMYQRWEWKYIMRAFGLYRWFIFSKALQKRHDGNEEID